MRGGLSNYCHLQLEMGIVFFNEQSFFRMNEIFSEKECRPEKTNDV